MANIKSQIKRNRQNEQRRVRNRSVRSALKTRIKDLYAAIDSGDAGAAQSAHRDATRAFDKAVAKGIIHKNKAANLKSRLAARLSPQR